MSENTNSSPEKKDRFNHSVAVLIALVTTCIAIVSYIQGDAANRDDQANRDSKRYSLEAMERKVSGDALVNYDYNNAYQTYYEYELLAFSASEDGDEQAARTYNSLRDRMLKLSPLLQAPYFDPASGKDPDVARYEADVYLVDTTRLTEKFNEATKVKEAWDYKANTYIIHITLLAVALFLFGMATTISGPMTRWIFAASGGGVSLLAIIWALTLYLGPVPDLRDCKTSDGTYAIDDYAQGVGLAHRSMHKEALEYFNKAISCDSGYVSALVDRSLSLIALEDYKSAALDLEKARAVGDRRTNTAGELAMVYYMQGRLDDAANMNREALQISPDEYWIQFDLALSLLAAGRMDEAKTEYKRGMDLAAKTVADADAAKAEPPSYLWYGLEDAAESLDDLLLTISTGEDSLLYKSLVNSDEIVPVAESMIKQLKSYAVALEYTGKPPAGDLAATFSPFVFAEIVWDDAGEAVDYNETEAFPAGTYEVAVLLDFEGMQDGQEALFKVYVNGEEDPAWRVVYPWDLGSSGSVEKQISLADSMTQVLKPGEYAVELYINSQLAQRGTFTISE